MATPTTYDLNYDDPCQVEDGCETEQCPDKINYTSRPKVFCKTVEALSTVTVLGETTMAGGANVVPPEITVGGQTFVPTIIQTISGPHLVLAVY